MTNNLEKENQLLSLQIKNLQATLDNIGAYVFTKDLDGKYTYVNELVRDLFGYPFEEIIGFDDTKFFSLELSNDLKINDHKVMREGKVIETEEKNVIAKTGKTRFYMTVKKPLFDHNGKIIGMFGISTDITERKLNEQELLIKEEEQSSLIAALPDVIMRFDLQGRHLFVSENVEKVTGIPASSFIGKTHIELGFPKDMCTLWENAIQQALLLKTTYETEFELDGPSGHASYNWRLTPDLDAEGKVHSLLAVARDITQQKAAEQQVKLQAMVLDQIQDHVTVTDLKGNILYVNESEVKNIGGYKGNIIGQMVSVSGDAPDSEARQMEIFNKTLAKGNWHGEVINFGENDNQIVLDLRTSLIKDEQDIAIAMVGVSTDITKRKKVELFSQNTAEILEMIATGKSSSEVYDAIALMYEERHPGMRCSLLELEDGILLHGGAPSMPKAYCDAVHGLHNGPNVGSCGTSTYTGKRCLVENIETHPNWANIKDAALPHGLRCCWSEPVIDSKGKVMGAFGMYYNHPALPNKEESKDLTSAARLTSIVMERDHYQQKLIEHREQLEKLLIEANHANEAKSQFLANMSHEIRTPMNGVIGVAQLLNETELDRDQSHFVSTLLRSSNNLLTIINDVLDLSKIEAGMFHLETTKFELLRELRESRDLHLPNAETKDIKLELILPEEPKYILGDSTRLRQVIINLLSNAIKFTHHGNVKLMVTEEKQTSKSISYKFMIKDSGIGIPVEKLDHIFDGFGQADESITRKYGGTGLGLTISNQLVGLMGGHLQVESKEGQGSQFFFILEFPLAKTQQSDDVEKRQTHINLDGVILLVEDNKTNQLIAKKMLQRKGLEVVVANNGFESIELFASRHIDLVLMDMQMPVMGGVEATREIRRKFPDNDTPIVALTANVMPEHKEQCMNAGMNDFIPKPVKMKNLDTMLSKYLLKI